MAGVSRRLYIGDIPVSVNDGELKEILSKYGDVSSIELKTKAHINESSNSKTFAYADVSFESESKLNKCLDRELTVRGSLIRVQVAKEHFLKRLERERRGDVAADPRGRSNVQNTREVFNRPVPRRRFNDDDEVVKKTMFQRLESISTPVQEDEKQVTEQLVEKTKQQLDDEKRMKSLMAVQEEKERQQKLIRESLRNPAARNKRIVFDSDSHSSPKVNGSAASRSVPKTPLFDNGDEDMNDLSLDQCLNRSAKQADQLVQMQSQFAHDSRFQVDQSFLEEEDDAAGDGDEKSRNMDILESVLKKPLMPSDAKPVKEILVPRYDPLSADAAKYEIKRKVDNNDDGQAADVNKKKKEGKNDKNKKAKMRENKKLVVKPEAKPAETSREMFYSVSESLAQVLKTKMQEPEQPTVFKFSSLFRSEQDQEEGASQNNDLWNWTSSDKHPVESKVGQVKNQEGKVTEIAKERDLFAEHFFLSKNDPRLDEDPFFDPKVIKRLRDKMKDKLVKGMDVTLAKKNKAARNKRTGHVYQTFKRKTDDGEEYEEKVLKNKEQFKKKKFRHTMRPQVTNKLSARQERLRRDRQEGKGKPVQQTGDRNRGKAFFANKKAKV